MRNNHLSRRRFIKGTLGTGLLLSGSGLVSSFSSYPVLKTACSYDPKGLPTRVLGKTGVQIPRIALGLGSRFCSIRNAEEAFHLLNFALDNGLYYWDTAWQYENKELQVISEERIGMVANNRRKEIFLSTKVYSRDPDEAMRQIETSLKRLQTGNLDMLKIHDVQDLQDVARLSEKGNLIDILHRMKAQGVTRFIGFSGHTDAAALKAMAERGDFDSMLMAMNHYNMDSHAQLRQEQVIPAARGKGMGVMLMKVVRPKENNKDLKPEDLIRYALSLDGPDGIVLGTDSMEVVKSNLEILRNFKTMDGSFMQEMTHRLAPFYLHEHLPWMHHGYRDGNWV